MDQEPVRSAFVLVAAMIVVGCSSTPRAPYAESESAAEEETTPKSPLRTPEPGPSMGSQDEAPAVKPSCKGTAPFDRVEVAKGLSTTDDEGDVRLTADELTVVISRYNGYGEKPIIIATRASKDEDFGTGGYLTELKLGAQRGTISPDGLQLFYQAQIFDPTKKVISYDVFRVDRTDTKSAFGNERGLSGINTPSAELQTFLPATGKTLYFASDRTGSDDLFAAPFKDAQRSDVDAPTAAPFTQVNTADQEWKPVVSADELTVYYGKHTTDRPKDDIWIATRTSVNDPFGPGKQAAELSSEDGEAPSWISPDGCRLYFWSARPGGPGLGDIYVATKDPR